MLIVLEQEKLLDFLREEVTCWHEVGGGPNMKAFKFDPKTIDPKMLEDTDYHQNRDSWVAGVQVQALLKMIEIVENAPQAKIR